MVRFSRESKADFSAGAAMAKAARATRAAGIWKRMLMLRRQLVIYEIIDH